MNRTDAAAILNIDPTASAEEARKAYQELFTEHQMRLTNAPTPALRSLYQARLRELDEARDALLAAPPVDATSDLPTDQPSISDRVEERAPPKNIPPGPPPPPRRAEGAASPPKPPPPPPPVRETPKSNPAVKIGIGLAIVAIIVFVLTKVGSNAGKTEPAARDTAGAAPTTQYAGYADSIRAVRDAIAIARVELNRADPDYAGAIKSLTDGDRIVASLPASANADTVVARLKIQLASERSAVVKACQAMRRVAQARGDPLPNCGT